MAVSNDAAGPPEQTQLSWAADNPLVRAVGRVRLPLAAKLIAGFATIAGLLALVAGLGLIALGQSNSRGTQLRRLQQQAVYEQLLLTDASQLKKALDFRIASGIQTMNLATPLDQEIANQMNQLCDDAGLGGCVGPSNPSQLPLKLQNVSPSLLGTLVVHVPLFYSFSGDQLPGTSGASVLRQADYFMASFSAKLRALAQGSRAGASALVAANQGSYGDSRNILIGVGSGSLALALVLGLLLSWSVVAPLRRTQHGLATIAAGDFGGRVDVPNRDEIGALAADVNRMNVELGRLYHELETASRHKSDFLSTMSHELRTPLNAIIGFSEVLHEQMFGELNERQLAYVNDVLAAGKHLLSLINDVLDLAKIEAGRMELDLSQVAIPDVLRSAVSMHAERASRAGIALALTTQPDQITVTGDERRVRQIVFNLLSNAVKFTPQHGRIDVSARLDDGRVEIAIADTGPGIAREELERIFEEFEQTSHGKQAEEGTGLGLPLSRKLVELHGGRLSVESEVGKGSTFRFTLPVHHPATV